MIVCELCECHEFIKQDDMFVCQGCGTKYTSEQVRSMMKEVEGAAPAISPSPAKNSDFDKYLLLARRAKDSENSADAAKYYGMAQSEAPNNWECAFFSVYFTAMQTNIAGIASAANLVSNCLASVIDLIKHHTPQNEQLSAAIEVVNYSTSIAIMLKTSARSHYNGIGESIRGNYTNELRYRANAARLVAYNAGVLLDAAFGNAPEFHKCIAEALQTSVVMKESDSFCFPEDECGEEFKIIAKYNPDFVRSRVDKLVAQLDARIAELSKPTKSRGCGGIFLLIIGLGFIIWGTTIRYSDVASFAYFAGAAFAIPGLIMCLPLPKSEKQKAMDANNIKKLEEEKRKLKSIFDK